MAVGHAEGHARRRSLIVPKPTARAYAELYAKRGWKFIPLRFESKQPARKGWADLDSSFEPEAITENVGVVLGAISGDLVDIDLDSKDALALAPYFLPETLTFGHKSKPASHWLYISKGVRADKLWFGDPSDHDDRELVEIRANNASGEGCGHQTAFPGSVWSSKDGKRTELVEFDNDAEPTEVDASELIWAVAKLATAATIAKGWTSGRHEKSLSITGGLLKAGWSAEEVRECMSAVREVCGDTPEEEADFGHDVESTIAKAESEGLEALSGFGSLVASGVLREHEAKALERHSRSPSTRKREATLASTRMGAGLLAEMVKHAREVDGLEAVGDIVARGNKAREPKGVAAGETGPVNSVDYGAWVLQDLTTEPEPINYVIEGLALGPGKISTLNGSPGTAKGVMLSLIALCVASGRECLGHPVRRARVFYCDAETGRLAQTRIKRLARAMGIDLAELQGEGWLAFADAVPPVTDEWLDFLEAQLVDKEIGLFIGDSYTSLVGGEQNESSYADAAWRLGNMSNRLGVTVLASTHARKKPVGGKTPMIDMTSGHGTLVGAQQAQIYVVRPDEGVSTELEYHCVRAGEEGFAPFRIRWSDVPNPKAGKGVGSRLNGAKWGLAAELVPIPTEPAKTTEKQIAAAAAAEDLKARIRKFLKSTGDVTQTTIRNCVTGSNIAIRDALVALCDDPTSHVERVTISGKDEYRWRK